MNQVIWAIAAVIAVLVGYSVFGDLIRNTVRTIRRLRK